MSPNTNRVLSSVAAWVFGLATSVLFVSIWGRAVIVDTAELGDSLMPLSQSEQVASAFENWIKTELMESGIPASEAETASEAAVATDEVSLAIEHLFFDVVAAAADEGLGTRSVDVASILQPTVPAVTDALIGTGTAITESQVAAVVARLDPLVIRKAGETPAVGPASPLASRLGTAAILAVLLQGVFGSVYVLTGTDRLKRTRTLLGRFALTGMSFAVLLKAGSWVLDPAGGRAPVSESVSLVANSKWVLPAFLGGAGAVAAIFVWLARAGSPQAVTPGIGAIPAEGSPEPVGTSTPHRD